MSTLSNTDLTVASANITTLKDGSENNPSTPSDILQGRAKAWVNFNGSTFATRNSFNATVTDRGTGIYTITFGTDFAAGTYSSVFGGGYITGATGDNTMVIVSAEAGYTPAVGSINISSHYVNGTESDFPWICASFFGEQ